MSNESSAGEKALYFMVGAMIGAATALLLAPRSGVETRKLIMSKAREGADVVTNRAKTVVGKTSEYVERGKELLQQHDGFPDIPEISHAFLSNARLLPFSE